MEHSGSKTRSRTYGVGHTGWNAQIMERVWHESEVYTEPPETTWIESKTDNPVDVFQLAVSAQPLLGVGIT